MNEVYSFGNVTMLGNLFKLEEREMTPEHYDSYKKWSQEISEKFEQSKKNDLEIYECVISEERIFNANDYEYAKYGTSNLKDSGCAIFSVEYISRILGIEQLGVVRIAKVVADKGYYMPGKGTWHHLFDRLGAIRINNVNMIFLELRNYRPVTVLLPGYFVNIIGVRNGKFVVEDSSKSERQYYPVREFLDKIKIAWIW